MRIWEYRSGVWLTVLWSQLPRRWISLPTGNVACIVAIGGIFRWTFLYHLKRLCNIGCLPGLCGRWLSLCRDHNESNSASQRRRFPLAQSEKYFSPSGISQMKNGTLREAVPWLWFIPHSIVVRELWNMPRVHATSMRTHFAMHTSTSTKEGKRNKIYGQLH